MHRCVKDELVCKREEVLQHLANAADTHLVLLHTVTVLSFIYNYSENSSKYEYKYEYKVASTSTSTST